MNRQFAVLVAALAIGALVPAGVASAQYAPPGSQIYRDPPPQGPRGLPPAWLVDDGEDAPLPPPPGYYPAPRQPDGAVTAPAYRQAAPGAVPQQPGAAPAAQPQTGAPAATAALPPEDQPETGEPKSLPPELQRQLVDYKTTEPAGTIIVDTAHTYLYLTLGNGKALRYGIGVGREGFTWSGVERVSRMKEWPDWFPPAEMIERQPYLPRMMAGGPGNPLGARALYLGHTLYRIHGTNQPSTIGQYVSSGCIRLLNKDIEDLYSRVQVGTRVVVLPGAKGPAVAGGARPDTVMTIGQNGAVERAEAGAPMTVGQTGAIARGPHGVSSAPLPAVR
jgi:lipoprotein-anchoring transpeptidase ErfK/SrfK